jgi:hypothetical protein
MYSGIFIFLFLFRTWKDKHAKFVNESKWLLESICPPEITVSGYELGSLWHNKMLMTSMQIMYKADDTTYLSYNVHRYIWYFSGDINMDRKICFSKEQLALLGTKKKVFWMTNTFGLLKKSLSIIIIIIIIPFNRFPTKHSRTWIIAHNKESATIWNLKPEWWGSPLDQEEQ